MVEGLGMGADETEKLSNPMSNMRPNILVLKVIGQLDY